MTYTATIKKTRRTSETVINSEDLNEIYNILFDLYKITDPNSRYANSPVTLAIDGKYSGLLWTGLNP